MADYNIQIMRYNGDSYDNLYPETKTSSSIQVFKTVYVGTGSKNDVVINGIGFYPELCFVFANTNVYIAGSPQTNTAYSPVSPGYINYPFTKEEAMYRINFSIEAGKLTISSNLSMVNLSTYKLEYKSTGDIFNINGWNHKVVCLNFSS